MNKLRQHLHSQQAKVIQIVSLMKAKMQMIIKIIQYIKPELDLNIIVQGVDI